MEMNICSLARYFHDEAAAWELMESLRWPNGPECPHCGAVDQATFLKPRTGQRTTSAGNPSFRRTWKCRECHKKFSVLVGSIFENSRVPLTKWLAAIYMMCANKNGVAAFEIHRTLKVTNKTAWFMMHRIREATKSGPLADMLRGTIVADETYIGGNPKNRHASDTRWRQQGLTEKTPVLALVNATTGEVRSTVIPWVATDVISKAIGQHVDVAGSRLHTDSGKWYRQVGKEFVFHGWVNHSAGEYVRDGVSTNRAEGYFSQLKTSITGTHHGVSAKHLPRYLAEFDFRYSTCKMSDSDRMVRLMAQTGGRRLTYRAVKSD